jgi:hypothetical protein
MAEQPNQSDRPPESPAAPAVPPEPLATPPGGPTPPPQAPAAPPPTAQAMATAASMVNRFNSAEQMAVGGAALIVLVELVFGMVLEGYWAGDVPFVLALGVLGVAFMRRIRNAELHVDYVTVLKAAGFAVAALAVIDLVYELRHGYFDNATDILGGAGYYIGAALMFAGAWMVRRD